MLKHKWSRSGFLSQWESGICSGDWSQWECGPVMPLHSVTISAVVRPVRVHQSVSQSIRERCVSPERWPRPHQPGARVEPNPGVRHSRLGAPLGPGTGPTPSWEQNEQRTKTWHCQTLFIMKITCAINNIVVHIISMPQDIVIHYQHLEKNSMSDFVWKCLPE